MQLLLLHKTIFPQHLQCIDTMKKFFCFIYLTCLMLPTSAQGILSLDSCRALAVANNKELLISREKINAAHYRKKEAFTNYLPKISATGGYMRNQKEFSLLNDAQKGALGSVGTQVSGALQNGIQGMMTQYPQLAQNPQFMALVQSLGNIDIATPLNGLGQSLVDAFRTDTRNMYAGALTLTQPLYMGGKIRAYNKITRYAEELARQQHNSGMQEVILSTDQAYWQVVSLANKKKLAEGYLELLQKLESDIDKMIAEGVATKADGLSVKVKVNEAEMTLTKVNDGLSLSRMLLCQLCGLDLSTPVTLADEQEDDLLPTPADSGSIDMNSVYATRPEVRSLELAGLVDRRIDANIGCELVRGRKTGDISDFAEDDGSNDRSNTGNRRDRRIKALKQSRYSFSRASAFPESDWIWSSIRRISVEYAPSQSSTPKLFRASSLSSRAFHSPK